ncbi:MAG: trypsin-like peptidase domain-containing protein [Gammaproteobacteria bacterium]|nr:trypsin-like peptidase domain-containing protein [Gammaproteobacteria bacterium]
MKIGNRTPVGAKRRTNKYSQSPFQILVCNVDGYTLSSATAFYFETDGKWFLITNWHVVSGRNFLTGEALVGGGEPLSLNLKLATYVEDDCEDGEWMVAPHSMALFEGENPVWLEHPSLERWCDVVAIPTERPDICPRSMHNAVNLIDTSPISNIPIKPGGDVFIIGFPQSISVGFGLPLWKSGYIASEPHYDIVVDGEVWEYGGMKSGTRLPAFFVDAQTRKGMSGAPVFARYIGVWDTRDPYTHTNANALVADLIEQPAEFFESDDADKLAIAAGVRFVGCYSGRIVGDNAAEAGLGLCWREEVIEMICRQGKPGKNPHISYLS